MSRELIATRLKSAMGLHTPTVGMVTISSAIDRRMRECGIDSYSDYLMKITADNAEMKELIEAVIIPETWFFREAHPYRKLLEHYFVHRETSPGTPFRILSIPCSTGEEPYSIAMLMMDNNIDPNTYTIEAVDIGEKHIRKASNGCYRKHSFRSEDLSFVYKHFTIRDELYYINENVKERVNFRCANILDNGFNHGFAIYDFILCRNLLIYFDGTTQSAVFNTIDRLLKPDGILALGHAETPQHSAGKFVPTEQAGTYVYVKPASQLARKQKTSIENKHENPVSQKNHPSHTVTAKKPRPFIENRPEEKPAKPVVTEEQLDKAFKLANNGKLHEALELCVNFIESNAFSSRAHYLAGIINDHIGNTSKADEHLRKSIYLDPNNIEALIHLSLMAEQSGDSKEALLLRSRVQRVQHRSSDA